MTHHISVASVVEAARRRFDEIQAITKINTDNGCLYAAPCIIGATITDLNLAMELDEGVGVVGDSGVGDLLDAGLLKCPPEDTDLIVKAQDIHDRVTNSDAPIDTRRFWMTRLIDALEARNADLIADLRGEVTRI